MPEDMLQNSVPPEMRSMLIAQSARMNMPQQQINFSNGTQQAGGFPMQNIFPGMNMTPDMMAMGMGNPMNAGFGPSNIPMGGPMGQYGPGMDAGGQLANGMGGMPGPSELMQSQQQQQQLQSQQHIQQLQQQSTPIMQLNGHQPLPNETPDLTSQAQPSEDGSVAPVSTITVSS